MNIKDEHTSRLWTFIMKGEIMAFELDEDELIATRVNNKAASWNEVEEYIEKYYVKKDKIREKIKDLEEENKDLRHEIDLCNECEIAQDLAIQDSVQKSVIREKIEKLKILAEKSETEEDLYAYKNKIYALNSLLQEGDK